MAIRGSDICLSSKSIQSVVLLKRNCSAFKLVCNKFAVVEEEQQLEENNKIGQFCKTKCAKQLVALRVNNKCKFCLQCT